MRRRPRIAHAAYEEHGHKYGRIAISKNFGRWWVEDFRHGWSEGRYASFEAAWERADQLMKENNR